jgi:hypothetical protein
MFEQKILSHTAKDVLADIEEMCTNSQQADTTHAAHTDAQWFIIQRGCGSDIRAGDMLCVRPEGKPIAGSLVVLSIDNRLLLRRLQYDGKSVILEPLSGKVQALYWPAWEVLPIVGVVTNIVRSL